MDTAF